MTDRETPNPRRNSSHPGSRLLSPESRRQNTTNHLPHAYLHTRLAIAETAPASFKGTYLPLIVLQSLAFTATLAMRRRVRRHGALPAARSFATLHNRLYAAASLGLLLLILASAAGRPRVDRAARTLYHASKFWEYLDVMGVVAGGGAVGLHFAVHHLTTPYLTFARVVQHAEGWRAFAALNTLHHTLMYAYLRGL